MAGKLVLQLGNGSILLVSAKGSSATFGGASGALQAYDFVLVMSTNTLKNVVIPGTKVPQKNNFSQFLAVLCSLFTSALRYGGK